MRKGFRYLQCPDCGRKSVHLHAGPHDDGWDCRNGECDFYAYTGGNDTIDVLNRKRLVEVNPTQKEQIWIGDCYCDLDGGDTSQCPEHSTLEQFRALRAEARRNWCPRCSGYPAHCEHGITNEKGAGQ